MATHASEHGAVESPSGPSDSMPEAPMGREGRSVRLREAARRRNGCSPSCCSSSSPCSAWAYHDLVGYSFVRDDLERRR